MSARETSGARALPTRVLVTGGAGFIGQALVRRLVSDGVAVTVADRNTCPISGVRMMEGDLRGRGTIERAMDPRPDAVVHLAAMTSVLESVRRPAEVYETNVGVTAALLEAVRAIGTPRFVLASTNAVVGDVGDDPIDECSVLRPLTPYGATKAAAEMLLSAYGACYGVVGRALRFTNVYGPGMAGKDSVVARLMRAARDGTGIEIYGDGEQRRDYLYIADAVEAMVAALGHDGSGPLTVGSGSSVSMNELHAMACRATGVDISVKRVAARPGEMRAVVVDTSLARSMGVEARTELEEGLVATWRDVIQDHAAWSARR